MKTPFPGMDPYLEHPALWPGVHNRLIVCLANQLQPAIEPRYVASIEERVFIEGPQQQRVPDLHIKRPAQNGGSPRAPTRSASGAVVLEVDDVEIHESYINILDCYNALRTVAVIELVSPSNKVAGPGRDAYLEKQREVLYSDCHLIEIDLLRRGGHDVSVPEWRAEELSPYAYFACISRWPWRKRFEAYSCTLRERLPAIHVPLVAPDPDVPLDLQAALEHAYWEARYMRRLRYTEPCVPPLDKEDQDWAFQCIATYRQSHPDYFPA